MSSSYNRNIERMRSRERANVQQANAQRTAMANTMGQRGINEAKQLSNSLEAFSTTLQNIRQKQKDEAHERGAMLAQEQAEINSEKLIQLQEQLGTLTEEDTRYHEIKAEMLKVSGPDIYPDADRLTKMSNWEQAGFMKEKLRGFNDTFADKLNHAMMTSEKALNIENITFTPKELHDNNIHGMPFKEAAVHMIARDIRKNAGLHKFSPELLELAGTNEAIQKAKEDSIAKYRSRFNIESSSNTRSKAEKTWQTSSKTGDDIYHYLVKTGATVDGQNKLVGNAGAWKALDATIVSEGINQNDPEYAARILNQPMPDRLSIKLGAKKGTTYAEHWPSKVATLKQEIRDGYTKRIDNELKNLESAGTTLETEFITEARKTGDLSSDQVNEYKAGFGELGLPIPSSIKNYETVSDRNEREDNDLIEALMASQNGYISNEQLDAFHPKAAVQFREKATKLEKAALKEFDSEQKIKAALDTTFTGMGVKGNEKSLVYVEAFANAKSDYANKYNRYVAMGYAPAQASHLALYADGVKDKETGEQLPDSMGVLKEIETKLENSKYVVVGQSIEQSAKPGDIRVVQIRMGKEQISTNPNSVTTQVIGGAYGKKQLNNIQANIEKYGPRGLYMDQSALQYYKGLARGRNPREGGWWGIVDAQLKANGYSEGLSQSRPNAVSFQTGIDKDGNVIPDPRGSAKINNTIARTFKNVSNETVTHVQKMLIDSGRFGQGSSVWDDNRNWQSYVIPGYVSDTEMEAYLEKDSGLTNTGGGYKLDLPTDPLQRRKVINARREAEDPLNIFERL